jgi:hypothetical protein
MRTKRGEEVEGEGRMLEHASRRVSALVVLCGGERNIDEKGGGAKNISEKGGNAKNVNEQGGIAKFKSSAACIDI